MHLKIALHVLAHVNITTRFDMIEHASHGTRLHDVVRGEQPTIFSLRQIDNLSDVSIYAPAEFLAVVFYLGVPALPICDDSRRIIC